MLQFLTIIVHFELLKNLQSVLDQQHLVVKGRKCTLHKRVFCVMKKMMASSSCFSHQKRSRPIQHTISILRTFSNIQPPRRRRCRRSPLNISCRHHIQWRYMRTLFKNRINIMMRENLFSGFYFCQIIRKIACAVIFVLL